MDTCSTGDMQGLLALLAEEILPYLFMMPPVQGKTRLDPAVRALAMHLVAETNGCSWCVDFGLSQATKDHMDLEKLAAAGSYATSPIFWRSNHRVSALSPGTLPDRRGRRDEDVA